MDNRKLLLLFEAALAVVILWMAIQVVLSRESEREILPLSEMREAVAGSALVKRPRSPPRLNGDRDGQGRGSGESGTFLSY